MSGLRVLICGAFLVGLAIPGPVTALAGSLITIEEAALPPQKGAVPNEGRGILRGPKILFSDPLTHVQPSPIHFQVKFLSYGGTSIDLDALKVTYLKSPLVDLTPRIRPFAQATGIDMPDAQVPPGDHLVRVDIKDSESRLASRTFLIRIAP
jgi:hypothetical protein